MAFSHMKMWMKQKHWKSGREAHVIGWEDWAEQGGTKEPWVNLYFIDKEPDDPHADRTQCYGWRRQACWIGMDEPLVPDTPFDPELVAHEAQKKSKAPPATAQKAKAPPPSAEPTAAKSGPPAPGFGGEVPTLPVRPPQVGGPPGFGGGANLPTVAEENQPETQAYEDDSIDIAPNKRENENDGDANEPPAKRSKGI